MAISRTCTGQSEPGHNYTELDVSTESNEDPSTENENKNDTKSENESEPADTNATEQPSRRYPSRMRLPPNRCEQNLNT